MAKAKAIALIFAATVACSSAKASNPAPNVNVYVPPAVDATKFFEWLDSVQLSLTIKRTPATAQTVGYFQCFIDGAQVQQADGTRTSLAGQGQTPDEAIGAYLQLVRGRMITVNTQTFIAPTDIVNLRSSNGG